MVRGEDLHLDHDDVNGGYLGFSHAHCNTSAGATAGNLRRKGRDLVSDVVVGVEVSQDRTHVSIVACGEMPDGTLLVNLTHYLDGTAGAAAAVSALAPLAVVIDRRSPAVNLVGPLEDADHTVVLAQRGDLEEAHADFVDLLTAGKLKVTGHAELDQAVRHAQERVGDGAAVVRRRTATDAGPLIASQLALWGWRHRAPAAPEPFGGYLDLGRRAQVPMSQVIDTMPGFGDGTVDFTAGRVIPPS